MANRALLVGINAYPSAPLRGCVNDVQDLADLITSETCGFKPDEVRLVVDGRATAEAIVDRLHWLILDAQPGDRLLFHYSGHGALLPSRDASGNIATLHSCICPVDFDWTPELALTDDDFMRLFTGVPMGVRFYWTSDSCHSGGLARGVDPPDRVSRHFPVPADIAWGVKTALALAVDLSGLARSIEHLNGAFISGCRSDQTSSDAQIDGRYCGALTHYLLEELRGDGAGLPVTTLVQQVHSLLDGNGYEQDPELHGEERLLGRPWLST